MVEAAIYAKFFEFALQPTRIPKIKALMNNPVHNFGPELLRQRGYSMSCVHSPGLNLVYDAKFIALKHEYFLFVTWDPFVEDVLIPTFKKVDELTKRGYFRQAVEVFDASNLLTVIHDHWVLAETWRDAKLHHLQIGRSELGVLGADATNSIIKQRFVALSAIRDGVERSQEAMLLASFEEQRDEDDVLDVEELYQQRLEADLPAPVPHTPSLLDRPEEAARRFRIKEYRTAEELYADLDAPFKGMTDEMMLETYQSLALKLAKEKEKERQEREERNKKILAREEADRKLVRDHQLKVLEDFRTANGIETSLEQLEEDLTPEMVRAMATFVPMPELTHSEFSEKAVEPEQDPEELDSKGSGEEEESSSSEEPPALPSKPKPRSRTVWEQLSRLDVLPVGRGPP